MISIFAAKEIAILINGLGINAKILKIFMIHGDRRFFLISLDNSTFLVRDNCPHRGGPLHLGYFNCQNNAIVCPWHNSAVSVHRLQQLAMPLVWRNDVAIAVIPGAESTPIAFKHRYIMVDPEIGCNGG